jgi:2'-5' RNA ligase
MTMAFDWDQEKTSGLQNELHVAHDVPRAVGKQIRDWANQQKWPEGTELEHPTDYHITTLYSPEGHERKNEYWIEHLNDAKVNLKGLDSFGPSDKGYAIVIKVDSPELSDHANKLQDVAEKQGLEITHFPGGYQPHITLAYSPQKAPAGLTPPPLTFDIGPSKVSPRRYKEDEPEAESKTAAENELAEHPSMKNVAHVLHTRFEAGIVAPDELAKQAREILKTVGYPTDNMTTKAALDSWQTMYPQDKIKAQQSRPVFAAGPVAPGATNPSVDPTYFRAVDKGMQMPGAQHAADLAQEHMETVGNVPYENHKTIHRDAAWYMGNGNGYKWPMAYKAALEGHMGVDNRIQGDPQGMHDFMQDNMDGMYSNQPSYDPQNKPIPSSIPSSMQDMWTPRSDPSVQMPQVTDSDPWEHNSNPQADPYYLSRKLHGGWATGHTNAIPAADDYMNQQGVPSHFKQQVHDNAAYHMGGPPEMGYDWGMAYHNAMHHLQNGAGYSTMPFDGHPADLKQAVYNAVPPDDASWTENNSQSVDPAPFSPTNPLQTADYWPDGQLPQRTQNPMGEVSQPSNPIAHHGQIPGDEQLDGPIDKLKYNRHSGVNPSFTAYVQGKPVYVKPQGKFHYNDIAHERAAFAVAHAMGVQMPHTTSRIIDVPAVENHHGKVVPARTGVPAQVQHSVGGYPIYKDAPNEFDHTGLYDSVDDNDKADLRRIALFDNVIHNGDRHLGNIVRGDDGRVYPIDHGGAFQSRDEYMQDPFGFEGEDLTPDEVESLNRAHATDLSGTGVAPERIDQMRKRIRHMVQNNKRIGPYYDGR